MGPSNNCPYPFPGQTLDRVCQCALVQAASSAARITAVGSGRLAFVPIWHSVLQPVHVRHYQSQ